MPAPLTLLVALAPAAIDPSGRHVVPSLETASVYGVVAPLPDWTVTWLSWYGAPRSTVSDALAAVAFHFVPAPPSTAATAGPLGSALVAVTDSQRARLDVG